MKYINLDDIREGKLNSILKREKQYLYEVTLKQEHLDFENYYHNRLNPELYSWLDTNIEGKWTKLFEGGDIWGISFQKKKDAMLFKMVWL